MAAQKEHGSVNVQEDKTVVEALPFSKSKTKSRVEVYPPSFTSSSRTLHVESEREPVGRMLLLPAETSTPQSGADGYPRLCRPLSHPSAAQLLWNAVVGDCFANHGQARNLCLPC